MMKRYGAVPVSNGAQAVGLRLPLGLLALALLAGCRLSPSIPSAPVAADQTVPVWALLAQAEVGFGQGTAATPDYYAQSEQQLRIVADLETGPAQPVGILAEHPGMYRLAFVPAEDGGAKLAWSVRAGGAWRKVSVPVAGTGDLAVVADYDGATIKLTAGGQAAAAKHEGLMTRNRRPLWLGSGPENADPLRNATGSVRVARAVPMESTAALPASFPERNTAAVAVEPKPVNLAAVVVRPDGIEESVVKTLTAPPAVCVASCRNTGY
jgi:hypothetical protein